MEIPLPVECSVQISNEEVEDKQHLSLMFNVQPDGVRPVLYYKGKRVIDDWSIDLLYCQQKDQHGRSS